MDGLLQVNASAADWFVKVDDDTFLLYPNLLKLVAPLDPMEPLYLGLSLIYRPEVGWMTWNQGKVRVVTRYMEDNEHRNRQSA